MGSWRIASVAVSLYCNGQDSLDSINFTFQRFLADVTMYADGSIK